MSAPYPTSSGELPFDAPGAGKPCKTWYTTIGDLSSTPQKPVLIGIHGGPGSGHDYLLGLADVYAQRGVPVLLYDQIGCGHSTHLREKAGDASFWTVDLFLQELENLVAHLGLHDRGFHLLGQSWGGMLVCEYASRRPKGLRRVVMSGAPASMPLYKQACQLRLAEMPGDVAASLAECDRKGDHESEAFKKAAAVFMKNFVCRLEDIPEPLQRTFGNVKEDSTAYNTM